jgi:hypothetical protein
LLSHYYNNSLLKALQTIYPDHAWDGSQFRQVSSGYWRDTTHQRDLFEKIGQKMNIRAMEDWYKVTLQDATKANGKTIVLGILWQNYSQLYIDSL